MPQLEPIKTSTDQDGDVIMSNASEYTTPSKEKSLFDWFSFEGKTAPPKSPTDSPTFPNPNVTLSVSTASQSGHFESPVSNAQAAPHRPAYMCPADGMPPMVRFPAQPARALKWVWQCHSCGSRYPLAVTRRCLNDGHYYCSGNSEAQRNIKKKRKHLSCTSEFDYVAWKEWGHWRRKTLALRAFAERKQEPKLVGCEGCNSPSQCRYEHRARVEVIKFDDFIEEKDIISNLKEGASVRHSANGGQPNLSKRDADTSPEEKKDAKSRKSFSKKGLKVDSSSPSSPFGQKLSGRSRFYSSLSASLSSRDLSPTSDLLGVERGRFDPTLSSVTKSAAKEKEELMAIESTLKAALAKQNQQLTPSTSASNSKRRLNSKKDDSEFEISLKEVQIGLPGLQRTMSQPSPLTDFFKQSKPRINAELHLGKDDRRTASEAEIVAFLQSKPTWEIEEDELNTRTRASLPANNVHHFEDIELSGRSPSLPHRTSTSSAEAEKSRSAGSQDLGGTNSLPANAGDESGRGGITFGLPSFVSGRK